MMRVFLKKKSAVYWVILLLQIAVCIYFGFLKKGFHEDEFYSYFSSNRTAGLFVVDRDFVDSSAIRSEFVVNKGESFRYGLVKLVQSWDVHPPFYYDILHTACSVCVGQFSKWIGIGINLIAFVLAWFVLYLILKELEFSIGFRMMILTVWGFHPMTISFVMFCRMYMYLTFFVHLCAYLHIRLIKVLWNNISFGNKKENRLKQYIHHIVPIIVCSFFGFLTHYYYIIFFFYIALMTCLYWIFHAFRRNSYDNRIIKQSVGGILVYGASCILSLLLGVVAFPSSVAQIFHGYRGKGAINEFVSAQNTLSRLRFFGGLLNRNVFGGAFYLIVIFIIAGNIYFAAKKKKTFISGKGLMKTLIRSKVRVLKLIIFVSAILYFLTVAKTALLLGDSSNRYEYPVYGLVIMMVMNYFLNLLIRFSDSFMIHRRKTSRFCLAFCVIFIVFDFWADFKGDMVLFLYPKNAESMSLAREHAESEGFAVVLYNSASSDKIWWLSDKLMEYPRIYMINEDNSMDITEELIKNADNMIVYAADGDNKDERLSQLLDTACKLSSIVELDSRDNWTTYSFEK